MTQRLRISFARLKMRGDGFILNAFLFSLKQKVKWYTFQNVHHHSRRVILCAHVDSCLQYILHLFSSLLGQNMHAREFHFLSFLFCRVRMTWSHLVFTKNKKKCILVSEVCARADDEGRRCHIAKGGYIKHTVEGMSFVSFLYIVAVYVTCCNLQCLKPLVLLVFLHRCLVEI